MKYSDLTKSYDITSGKAIELENKEIVVDKHCKLAGF